MKQFVEVTIEIFDFINEDIILLSNAREGFDGEWDLIDDPA